MGNRSYENDFDWHENETACRTHFHMKGFALRLVLTQRHKRTRKWPIRGHSHVWISPHVSFSLVLVLIEKIYVTLEMVFLHISKHLKFSQNTPLRIDFVLNSLLDNCRLEIW